MDVAELLKKAFVHVKKMRVMKEHLEFAAGSGLVPNFDFDGLCYIIDGVYVVMTPGDQKKFDWYCKQYHLWMIISTQFWQEGMEF